MQWAYETYGEAIYTDLAKHEKAILEYAEKQELNLNAKNAKTLVSSDTWKKQFTIYTAATLLLKAIGEKEFTNFNTFKSVVDEQLKKSDLKLAPAEKSAILNAVSWYDVEADKVEKGIVKLSGEKLEKLLSHLNCKEKQLADYGYFPTAKKGEYLTYETESDLRDTENVPLKENIYDYFIREVKPHVEEAWINLDATKIGYEISFNKYFYQHKPLRAIEEVTADILALEKESDGLIAEILGL
jgi:type I restriction enzyme M protein